MINLKVLVHQIHESGPWWTLPKEDFNRFLDAEKDDESKNSEAKESNLPSRTAKEAGKTD